MKYLYFFTEEPSIEPVILELSSKILPAEQFFVRVFPHEGKEDLKKALRKTVPSISRQPDALIIILHDQDSKDCIALKEELATQLGTVSCPYKIRIVCDELESWYLGDLPAIKKVYPQFDLENFQHRGDYQNVDAISKPSQRLLQIVPDLKGLTRLPKVKLAKDIAPHLNPEENQSESFRQLMSAINELCKPANNL